MKHVLLLLALGLGLARPAFAGFCDPVAMAAAADSAWDDIALKPDHLREWVETFSDESPSRKFLLRLGALNGVLSGLSTPLVLVPPSFRGSHEPFPGVQNVHIVAMSDVPFAARIDLSKAWFAHFQEKKGAVDFHKIWEWVLPRLQGEREARLVARGFEWGLYEVDPHAHIETAITYNSRQRVQQDPNSPDLVQHTTFDWKGTKVGYLAIKQFDGNAIHLYVGSALDAIRKSGARGLILDLRDNGGGQIFNASRIGGFFMGKGKPMIYQEDIVTRQPHPAPMVSNAAQRIDVPIIILVNNLTASASEVLAGALQYYGNAYLLGEPTYGKGTILQPVAQATAQRGALKGLPIYFTSTSALYYLPSMRSPQRYGLPIDFPYAQPGQPRWLREIDHPASFQNAAGPIPLVADARRNHLQKLFEKIERPPPDEEDPQAFAAAELFHLWLQ